MRKSSDTRTPSDLNELMAWVKNVPFFKSQGITGRDLADICEFLTYEHVSYSELLKYGENYDNLYIVMDGNVDLTVNLMKHNLGDKELDELCEDLMLEKKSFVKKVIEFKNSSGIIEI